jgi:hypothetical protein
MLANRRKGRMIASLAVALLATSTLVSPAQAGPISDMLARHRQAKAMKLPPVTKPHTIQSIKDPNARTASLSQKFKQRFNLKKNSPSTSTKDQSVIKTTH